MAETTTEASVRALPTRYASLIAAVYLVVGALYIELSGALAARAAQSIGHLRAIELAKGWAFVATTAGALFWFSRRLFVSSSRQSIALAKQRDAFHELDRRAHAGAIASAVAHDSNNELQIIGAHAAVLGGSSDPAARESGQEIGAAIERLGEMMRRLRDLGSQARAHRRVSFDLAEEVRRSVARARRHERVRGCHLTCDADAPLPMVGYPVLVDEIVLNLVLNAADATQGAGTIRVRTFADGDAKVIELEDDGPGISPELRERVFEPFFTTKTDGTGLGLWSVRASAAAHEGTIAVGDSGAGGARFTVRLRDVTAASAAARDVNGAR